MGTLPLQIMVGPVALLFVALLWLTIIPPNIHGNGPFKVLYSAGIVPDAWAYETAKNGT
jgi:hypothetical protein